MVEVSLLIALVGLLIFVAHLFAWLFSFTSVPDGLLLMAVGLVLSIWISPSFFGDFGSVILTLALVVMLFVSGTKLEWSVLRQAFAGTLRLVITSFLVSMLGIGLAVWLLLDVPFLVALILGSIVGGTTSGVIIPLLDRLSVQEQPRTLLILESAFSDVLTIVVTLALLAAYRTGNVSLPMVAWQIVMMFFVASLLGVVAGIVWSLLLNQVRHVRNSIFITPAFVFVLYGLVELIGFSGLVAALAFGVVLGNITRVKVSLIQSGSFWRWVVSPEALSKREKAFFSEIVFLLQTYFFVFVGLSLTFSSSYIMGLALGLSLLLMVLRYVTVRSSVSRTVMAREASLMALMIPRGLAAAVLATLVVEEGVESGLLIQELVYGIILWSIVLTSLGVFLFLKTRFAGLYLNLMKGYGTTPLAGTLVEEQQASVDH